MFLQGMAAHTCKASTWEVKVGSNTTEAHLVLKQKGGKITHLYLVLSTEKIHSTKPFANSLELNILWSKIGVM